MNLIRRLFAALSTIAVFVAIGAAIVIVIISQPASYVPNPDGTGGESGGPAIENLFAGITAISPYLPYLSIVVGLFLAIWLGVRLRDRRRIAKRRADDAFIRIDRATMRGKSDDLIRTWEEASTPTVRRGLFGLFRRSTPTTPFGEERRGFWSRLFRRGQQATTEVATPVDPFATFAPPIEEPPVEAARATDTPPGRRRPLAVITAFVVFVIGLLGALGAAALGVVAWAQAPVPNSIETLEETLRAVQTALETQFGTNAATAAIAAAGAVALLLIVLLSMIARRIARIGATAPQLSPVPTAPSEPADGDPDRPYRYVDLDAPLPSPEGAPAPAGPAASDDFAALFDDAIGAAPAASQPTAPVADPVSFEESFADPAAWGQAAGSASSTWGDAARPGSAEPAANAEIVERPETALADPDPTLFVPRRRHRIELLIGVIGGLIAGVLVTAVDPARLSATLVDLSGSIDPQLLTAAIATIAGATVSLLIVGAVRLLRRSRRERSATVTTATPLRRGRAIAVAALWILIGAALVVGVAVSIGANDPASFAARLTALIAVIDPTTSIVITLIVISFVVGFVGAAATTVRRAASAPVRTATEVAATTGRTTSRRLLRGMAFVLSIIIAGVIAGAGAARLGRGIAEAPAPSVAPTPTPSATPSDAPSEAPIAVGWTVVEGATGGWRIGFPAAPEISEVLTPSAAGELTSTTYAIAVGGTSYAVVVTDYPVGTIDAADPETIDGAVRGAAETVEGEIISTRTLSIDGAPGREAFIRAKETEFRTHIYIIESRLVQLIVGYPNGSPPLEVASFFDSFAIIPERLLPSPEPSPSVSPTPSPSGSPTPAPSGSPTPAPSGSPSGAAPPGTVIFTGRPIGAPLMTAREAVFFMERETLPRAVSAPISLPIARVVAVDSTTLRLRGRATFYDATKNNAWYTRSTPGSAYYHQDRGPYLFYAAASPALRAIAPFRWGGPPYRVVITNLRLNLSIVAWVVDECACVGGGIIDLSPQAWWAIGGSGMTPFSRGIIDVEVEVLRSAAR